MFGAPNMSRPWKPIGRRATSTVAMPWHATARWCASTIRAGSPVRRTTTRVGLAAVLRGRQSSDREGVDVAFHQAAERLKHEAVALDPALAGEGAGHDRHPDMAFALGASATMAGVARRFVDQ